MWRALMALLAVGCMHSSGDAADAPAGQPDAPAGQPDAPAGQPDASAGQPDAPAGHADAPTGQPDAPTGQPDAPTGRPDAPAGGCLAPPGSASASALAAYTRLSALRQTAGVSCATLEEPLDTSAAAHCAYYAANVHTPSCVANAHVEVASCSQFYAASFSQREVKAGYAGSPAFETMAFGASGADAVQIWVDSIWHRTPILSPWVRDVGYGDATGCATMDFGMGSPSPSTVVATWPSNGQTGVPTSFDGTRELPSPPAPPAGWPSGYPITIWIKGTVTDPVLTADGDATPLAIQFFGPSDDAAMGLLADDYVLYADSPLAGGTTYHLQASSSAGPIDLSFTTR